MEGYQNCGQDQYSNLVQTNMTGETEQISLEEVACTPTTLDNDSKKSKKHGNGALYLATLISDLMTFSAGVALGWSSPVLPQLLETKNLSTNPLGRLITSAESSWIGGLPCVGAIFGPLIAGPVAARIGRKRTLILIACPLFISFLIVSFADTIPVFYFARLLKGLAAGSVFAVLPMYVGEIATDSNRGALGCSMTVFTTAGFLFAYIVGSFLSIQNFSLACMIPLAIFLIVFPLWNPESPQFLASIGDQEGAQASLMKLRNTSLKEVEDEIASINRNLQELSQNKGRVKDLFRLRNLRRGITVSVGLINLQQFAGINPVLSYMETIFSAAGTSLSPSICTIIIGVVQFVITMLASFLVEKLGRRVLLLTSTVGSGIALIFLGLYFNLEQNNVDVTSVSWLPITSLFIYMVFISIGLQPLPWAILGELFPPSVKSTASTLTSVSCFVTATFTTVSFPFLVQSIGMAMSFWSFALNCLFGIIFVYLLVPETKGKSLQEIQKLLEK